MTTPPTQATFLVFALFISGLFGGSWAGVAATERARDPYSEFDTLVRIVSTIESSYVEDKPTDEILASAIRGVISDLDPHSRWMSSDEYRQLQEDTRGNYEGIGIEVQGHPAGPKVIRVLPGSPALRDGIQKDDHILSVDDESIIGLPLEEVVQRLRGPRGEPIRLTILREGWSEPRIVQTQRDRIHTPSVEHGLLPGKIAYLRLLQFQQGSGDELRQAVHNLQQQQGVNALILDLRDNRGGLLEQAVTVADLFLEAGTIVTTRGRIEPEEHFTAGPTAIDRSIKMAVLVNGLSASASEIVAGALKDTGRALLIGTRTFGKGSVQTVYEQRDESALKLTIGRYYTPSGNPIADLQGIEPDIIVGWNSQPSPKERLIAAIHQQNLPEADQDTILSLIDMLGENDPIQDQSIPWRTPLAERLSIDPQLQAAVQALQ